MRVHIIKFGGHVTLYMSLFPKNQGIMSGLWLGTYLSNLKSVALTVLVTADHPIRPMTTTRACEWSKNFWRSVRVKTDFCNLCSPPSFSLSDCHCHIDKLTGDHCCSTHKVGEQSVSQLQTLLPLLVPVNGTD